MSSPHTTVLSYADSLRKLTESACAPVLELLTQARGTVYRIAEQAGVSESLLRHVHGDLAETLLAKSAYELSTTMEYAQTDTAERQQQLHGRMVSELFLHLLLRASAADSEVLSRACAALYGEGANGPAI